MLPHKVRLLGFNDFCLICVLCGLQRLFIALLATKASLISSAHVVSSVCPIFCVNSVGILLEEMEAEKEARAMMLISGSAEPLPCVLMHAVCRYHYCAPRSMLQLTLACCKFFSDTASDISVVDKIASWHLRISEHIIQDFKHKQQTVSCFPEDIQDIDHTSIHFFLV